MVLKGEGEEGEFEDRVLSAAEALAVASLELLGVERLVLSLSRVDSKHLVALAVWQWSIWWQKNQIGVVSLTVMVDVSVSIESPETGLSDCVTEWFFDGS